MQITFRCSRDRPRRWQAAPARDGIIMHSLHTALHMPGCLQRHPPTQALTHTVHTDRRANNNNQTSPTVHATGRRPAATTTGACGRAASSSIPGASCAVLCGGGAPRGDPLWPCPDLSLCVGWPRTAGGFAWMMAPQRPNFLYFSHFSEKNSCLDLKKF
jgi:hypothetical protein